MNTLTPIGCFELIMRLPQQSLVSSSLSQHSLVKPYHLDFIEDARDKNLLKSVILEIVLTDDLTSFRTEDQILLLEIECYETMNT